MGDCLAERGETDGVVAAGEHDAGDVVAADGLQDVVGGGDVVLADLGEGSVGGEVESAAAADGREGRGQIPQVGVNELD
ncbi:MAG: hypothetical protein ACRDQ4_24850 [Pseudonocardiaceae bacterium]